MKKILDTGDVYISIVITCYNYENYIESCIKSALAQSYKYREIIVIDDGSNDNSWAVISRYSEKITAIKTDNQGFIKACLLGLERAAGTHIMFLDADDTLHPQALYKAVHFLKDADTAKVQFMMQPIDGRGKPIGRPFPNLSHSATIEYFRTTINREGCYPTPPTSGNIYRRDIYERIGPIDYDYGIDGVAYLFAPYVGMVIHISEVLASYRIHGANMSSNKGMRPETFARNAQVFLLRLQHLQHLISADLKISEQLIIRDDYQYVISCRVYGDIAAGRRPQPKLLRDLWLSRPTGMSIRKNLLYGFFLAMIFFSPSMLARKLVAFRLNPINSPLLRTFLKKITRS